MASGVTYREGWFIVASQGFHGILLDSRAFFWALGHHSWSRASSALRWMMLEKVLEDIV
jgi:hypothetical protein